MFIGALLIAVGVCVAYIAHRINVSEASLAKGVRLSRVLVVTAGCAFLVAASLIGRDFMISLSEGDVIWAIALLGVAAISAIHGALDIIVPLTVSDKNFLGYCSWMMRGLSD